RRELERGAVARAHNRAVVFVPRALAERPVVVGAAILDRVERAAAVVDADVGARPRDDQLDGTRRELVRRRHLDRGHEEGLAERCSSARFAGRREARTQGAPIAVTIGATEDAASRRPAERDGTATVSPDPPS